jgi:RimJ/RimL family protein N-acetyltransferase
VKFEPVDSAKGYAVMGILIGEPAWRGRGVAQEVLRATGPWLRTNRGIREVVLGVSRSNLKAIRVYEAVGFVPGPSPHLPYESHPQYLSMVWRL